MPPVPNPSLEELITRFKKDGIVCFPSIAASSDLCNYLDVEKIPYADGPLQDSSVIIYDVSRFNENLRPINEYNLQAYFTHNLTNDRKTKWIRDLEVCSGEMINESQIHVIGNVVFIDLGTEQGAKNIQELHKGKISAIEYNQTNRVWTFSCDITGQQALVPKLLRNLSIYYLLFNSEIPLAYLSWIPGHPLEDLSAEQLRSMDDFIKYAASSYDTDLKVEENILIELKTRARFFRKGQSTWSESDFIHLVKMKSVL